MATNYTMLSYMFWGVLFMLIVFSKIVSFIYNKIISTYFIINDVISYDIYIKAIQTVSKDNYFMNYGLWNKETDTLKDANRNLVDFIFEKSGSSGNILDVGCGYGEQDIIWSSNLTDGKITAIDISKPQIFFANKRREEEKIPDSKLEFKVGDAMNLSELFSNESFDKVISLESAFHYKNRSHFFKEVHNVLKKDGIFIIADISIDDNYRKNTISELFIKLFSDFLQMPTENIINSSAWKNDIKDSGFSIVETYDITNNTFLPYYKHFFEIYIKELGLPSIISKMLNNIFKVSQPFSYNILVCRPT